MSISQLGGPERLRAAAAAAALRKTALTTSVSTAPTVARQADTVSISDASKSLAAARTAVNAAPDVREDRISALKAAIANGTYSVDSRRLATAMISSVDAQ